MLSAMRVLRDGGVLGMFPEGTRSRTGRLSKMHPGTAMIALRTGATVVPCAITGTQRLYNPKVLLSRPRVSVTIGEPITIQRLRRPGEHDVEALMESIGAAISAMLPAAYRADA
jgi:1-acyl-sn-glycerol-3-phosphate acyltransferase